MSHNNRTLLIAFGANLGIAVAKFGAAAVTGSSAMLTEGVHSVVDSANQLLLIWGRRQARKPADSNHPTTRSTVFSDKPNRSPKSAAERKRW